MQLPLRIREGLSITLLGPTSGSRVRAIMATRPHPGYGFEIWHPLILSRRPVHTIAHRPARWRSSGSRPLRSGVVPLRRVGAKGVGRAAFAPITWEQALDEIADRFQRAAQRHGPEAVYPYYYAGTMGLVQRDGIYRLTHEMKYSRQKSTICVSLSDAGWQAGFGIMRGVDTRELAEAISSLCGAAIRSRPRSM